MRSTFLIIFPYSGDKLLTSSFKRRESVFKKIKLTRWILQKVMAMTLLSFALCLWRL